MTLWTAFKKSEAIFRRTVLSAKKEAWLLYTSSISAGTNSKEVWNKVTALKGRAAKQIKPLLNPENKEVIAKPKDIANAFANYYHDIFNTTSSDPFFDAHKKATEYYPLSFQHNSELYYNQPFTTAEIHNALSKCQSKSAGPDSLSFILFQQIPNKEIPNLLSFYNYIWSNGIPMQWKHSYLIPILKPGKISTTPNSYRLIALTNCICKIMERMINKRLQQYLEKHKITKPYQSGFRPGHSTLDPLVALQSDISAALQDKEYCIAIFLDITKAFDSVWHRGILEKLSEAGLQGNLPRFIEEFLTDRTYQVKIGNYLSDTLGITNGVPQGSVISPTLFSLVINDVFSDCPANVKYSLYADDGAFWLKTKNLQQGLNTAQQVLDNLNKWSHQNGLQFAAEKTKALIFTKKYKVNPLPLSINGHPIEYVKQIKFLGVIFDKRITWKPHIEYISAKCQPDLRLLRMIAFNKWGADFASLRAIYTAMTLPKITYANFLRTSTAKYLTKTLNRIQYAAARTMLGALRCSPTCTLEPEAGLMPLQLLHRKEAASYSCRVLSILNHPVATQLKLETYDKYHKTNSSIPAISYMRNELMLLGLSPMKDFPILSIADRLHTHAQKMSYNLHIANKEDLTTSQWQYQFNTLTKNLYESHKHIFTDGSVMTDRTGCGVWSTDFSLMARLSDRCSIFTAELYSIYIALNYLLTTKATQPYVIFSDSFSALQAIDNPTHSSHYLVHNILHIISRLTVAELIIEWIPSHQGIQGNEMADNYAKTATKLSIITNTHISYQDSKKIIQKDFTYFWHYLFRSSRNPLLKIYSTPNMSYPPSLTRPLQVAYTRLRLNTTTLTHQHYFTHELQPSCSCTPYSPHITVRHVLLDCLSWSTQRANLQKACNTLDIPLSMSSLLGDKRMIEPLMQYLQTTSLLNKL